MCPLLKWRITNIPFLARNDVEDTLLGEVSQIPVKHKSTVVIDINGGLTNYHGHPIKFPLFRHGGRRKRRRGQRS
jgi:hypothetical protein